MKAEEQPPVLAATHILYDDDHATLCYESGVEVMFSREELARLLAVKRRPRTSAWVAQHGFEPLPRLLADYGFNQRVAYADVHGDAAALAAFGEGAWLKSRRR